MVATANLVIGVGLMLLGIISIGLYLYQNPIEVKHLGVKPRGFSYFPQVISTDFSV